MILKTLGFWKFFKIFVLGLILVFPLGCGSGGGGENNAVVNGSLSGSVIKGPVRNGLLQIFQLDSNGVRGSNPISQIETNSQGGFQLNLGDVSGNFEVLIDSGNFIDEASGQEVSITPSRPLKACIAEYQAGDTRSIGVTPLTTLACGLTEFLHLPGTSAADAIQDANFFLLDQVNVTGLNFMDINIPQTIPALPLPSSIDLNNLTREEKYALILLGLSQQALANNMNIMDFIDALLRDISFDGKLDGMGKDGPILLQENNPLSENALKDNLTQSINDYLASLGLGLLPGTPIPPDPQPPNPSDIFSIFE